MKKISGISFLFFICVGVSRAALDLTPNEIKAGDGPLAKRYFFRDANKQLVFRIDSKMTVTGSSESVGFRFEDLRNAAVKMVRSPLTPGAPFDEKNLPAYRNSARSFLSPDALEVQMVEERSNPIAINGWTSHQFIFGYKLFGFDQRRSITFLNYNEREQLVIDVSAPADEYGKAYARGYQVLNSISALAVDPNGPT